MPGVSRLRSKKRSLSRELAKPSAKRLWDSGSSAFLNVFVRGLFRLMAYLVLQSAQ